MKLTLTVQQTIRHFSNVKVTGSVMRPETVCGIVTGDALVIW